MLIDAVTKLAIKISNEVLLPNFAKVSIDKKKDGSWVTKADTQAHIKLLELLPKIRDYPVLSEELAENEQLEILQSEDRSYWCVDPLDGTSNFIQGIPYWCMSIALVEAGETTLGVVFDPNREECFATKKNDKARLNGIEFSASRLKKAMLLKDAMGLVDFKRLDAKQAMRLATNPPYRSQRSFGASALDLCWIAANRCQVYLHGKQKIWDHAAGLLILKNAGGFAETFDSENVFTNELKNKSVIAASNKHLMEQWKDYLI